MELDKELIMKSHNNVVREFKEYYGIIRDIMTLYKTGDTYYDMSREEWLDDELDTMLGLLGGATLLLNLYNTVEEYELSSELYNEMKNCYLILTNEITPDMDNENMFIQMTDKMLESIKNKI
jgi:hypothetical protein